MRPTNDIIQKLESKLARQNAALQDTLGEIELAEKAVRGTSDPQTIRALAQTISQLRVKRLRQYNNALASEGYLKVLRSTVGVNKTDKPAKA